MEGTLTLFNHRVKAVFDTGATHSFIAAKILQKVDIVPQKLDIALNVVSPLGATITLRHVCKAFPLHLEDPNLPTNLIVLAMKELDMILGID